ncbi:hypothetical protein HHK36_016227 [Tetracentron sinense]|uniref:Alpha 1,4-glycosyltransferase domain-containing protein n=1 Tax=Tetracentron sinense TaxID=13715 RepID=A0A834YWU1_TETSI|nr:hypothetical protein HHK36_016227 [Tetracentron sinense]
MFNSRRLGTIKSPGFSTISFAAFFFVILFAGSVFSNLSLSSVAFRHNPLSHKTHRRFQSTSSPLPLLSVKEEAADIADRNPDLIPPFNVTEEERIAWFRKKLPEFEIFQSTGLTRQFSGRAQKFFGSGCEVRFFMTWISPARFFHRRELFALESLFKAHPHGCLMILSGTLDSRHGNQILKPLRDRGFRVLAVTPDLSFLVKTTPAEVWLDEMKKGNKDPGEIPLAQNLSNLLRLVALYKYGGIYLDTDFVVLKKLSGLRNSIGAQSIDIETGKWTRLNNAVLVFDKKHPLLFKFIEGFSLTFDGNKWGHNGPYLVSRVVQRVGRRTGYNFTVLPPMAFYPADWNRIGSVSPAAGSPSCLNHDLFGGCRPVIFLTIYGGHSFRRASITISGDNISSSVRSLDLEFPHHHPDHFGSYAAPPLSLPLPFYSLLLTRARSLGFSVPEPTGEPMSPVNSESRSRGSNFASVHPFYWLHSDRLSGKLQSPFEPARAVYPEIIFYLRSPRNLSRFITQR